MTENEINITDMIKALRCVASQDSEGDCYADHFNAHLTCEQFGDNIRLDEKHMSCGGILKDTQSCPYSQKTYGVCFEDGELWWLKDIVSILEEIQQYRAIGSIEDFIEAKASAEWAHEDLKAYQAIGTVEEIKTFFEENRRAGYKHGYLDGYVKAVDEFAEKLKIKLVLRYGSATPTEQYVALQVTDWCNEIAEQLKEGAE